MRRAFSIAEAIITIVILGLILPTIAMLLSQSTKSVEDSLEGEALYHASALITRIASMPFNSVLVDHNTTTNIINFDGTETECEDNRYRKGSNAIGGSGIKIRKCTEVTQKSDLGGLAYNPSLSAINHYQGFKQDIGEDRGFSLKVDLKYFDRWENAWNQVSPSADPQNFILITVTAYHTGDESKVIGVLNYVASNIGALE